MRPFMELNCNKFYKSIKFKKILIKIQITLITVFGQKIYWNLLTISTIKAYGTFVNSAWSIEHFTVEISRVKRCPHQNAKQIFLLIILDHIILDSLWTICLFENVLGHWEAKVNVFVDLFNYGRLGVKIECDNGP